MELDQWISIYASASQSAASRERSLWTAFAGGLIASSLFVTIIAYVVALDSSGFGHAFGLATSSLGLAVCLVWFAVQFRLLYECQHWQRLLRSVESQFAGVEFHRSVQRLLQGEKICVPQSAWFCDGWNPEPAHFPFLLRAIPKMMTLWIPVLFFGAFIAFLIGLSIS